MLQCDVMMHLMKTILDRALDLKRKSFQENHLQKVGNQRTFIVKCKSTSYIPYHFFLSDTFPHRLWSARGGIRKLSLLAILSMGSEIQTFTQVRGIITQQPSKFLCSYSLSPFARVLIAFVFYYLCLTLH